MRLTWRLIIAVAVFGGLFFLGLVFAPFVVAHLLSPLATTLWLFLRLFVLSIDQVYYWALLILLMGIWALVRLAAGQEIDMPVEQDETNAALIDMGEWQKDILFSAKSKEGQDIIRRQLIRMLANQYNSRQRHATPMEIQAALKEGQIPLPVDLHAFLFPPVLPKTRQTLQAKILDLLGAPQRTLRRMTGREAAEFQRSIDEVLSFMENSLEKKHSRG